MKKFSGWKKIAAVSLGLAVLGAFGLLIALKRLYPPEKIRAIALDRLQISLGREVRIEDAQIGLGGVTLAGIEISEIPNFAAGTSLKAEEIRIRVRIVPLILTKDIKVASIAMNNWEIRIQAPAETPENKDGAQASGGSSKELPAFSVSELNVKNGYLEYADPRAGTNIILREVAGSAENLRVDEPFDASLAFDFEQTEGKKSTKGSFDFDGTVTPARGDLSKAALNARALKLTYDGIGAELKGTIVGLNDMEINAALSIDAVSQEKLRAMASTPEGISLPVLKGELKARYTPLSLKVETLSLTGEGTELRFQGTRQNTDWSIAPSRIRYSALDLSFKGKLKVPQKGPVGLDLTLDTNRIALKEIAAAVPKAVPPGLEGNIELHLKAEGTSQSPILSGKAKFDGIGLLLSEQTLSNIGGKADFSPKSLQGTIKGKMNEGDLDVSISATDYSGKHPAYKINGRLSELDLGKLPSGAKNAPAAGTKTPPAQNASAAAPIDTNGEIVVGKIKHPNFSSGKTTVRWNLKNLSADLSGLNGGLALDVGPGELKDLALLSDKPVVKIVLMPVIILQKAARLVKVPLFPNFDRVEFKEITGDYTFKKGVMTVKESHMDSKIAYARMTGTADLGEDRLDLYVSTKLGIKQVSGPIGFKVKGSLNSPDVKPDAAAILKQPAVENVINQGKKLLDGFLKR